MSMRVNSTDYPESKVNVETCPCKPSGTQAEHSNPRRLLRCSALGQRTLTGKTFIASCISHELC